MVRKLMVTMLMLSLGLMTACGSKNKKDDSTAGAAGAAGEPDANVANKDMSFDSEGSDSGKIGGLKTVFFEYDQSNLNESAKSQLKNNADWIKKNPGSIVQIEGHCDSRGSVEYNLALGERRAKAVKGYLAGLGVEGKRLTIISYGKEKPITTGDSDSEMAKNRRANFVPLPK